VEKIASAATTTIAPIAQNANAAVNAVIVPKMRAKAAPADNR